MKSIVTWLVLAAWLLPVTAVADRPAKGRLLVATEVVQGEVFAKTVILLLHYDEHGAMGIVVNRPTDVELHEVLADVEVFSAYPGTLFWGGPVRMHSLRALLRTDSPPEGAEAIVGSVYQVPIDDNLKDWADPARLRYYIGYAGWSAGQLDRELARGSWLVVSASDDHVFSKEPRALWKRLSPPSEHRAATRTSFAL